MFDLEAFVSALQLTMSFDALAWLAVGISVGIAIGAMPGLNATTGVALMLPIAYSLSTAASLGLLIGLYKGAVYGGSISAISFATPGTPEAAATIADGNKLMQQGKGRKALLIALYASVTADTLSDILTILIAPMLALLALRFGPTEMFWLMVLSISVLGALGGSNLAKGLFAAGIGVFLATIGTDPVNLQQRNTFGLWWLADGIDLVPLVVGIFAVGTMLERSVIMLRDNFQRKRDETRQRGDLAALQKISGGEGISLREYFSCWKEIGIGFGVGSLVGLLPGLGATVGAFLSYSVAKNASPKKQLGTGRIEGIAAAEAGNNATVGPTLVPLLALGIPGSSVAALIGGALMLQGASPGPRMFELFPTVIYSLFILLIVGNLFNLGIGRMFAQVFARLGQLPQPILVPLVLIMAITGTYAASLNAFDIVLLMVFGLLGFWMRLFKIPEAPLIITFLMTPIAETMLRRSLMISRGDWVEALFGSPLAIGLAVTAGFALWMVSLPKLKARFKRARIENVGTTE